MEPFRLAVTGCPRYDLCAEKWRTILRYPRHGYILVNTNFSVVNPAYTRSAAAEREIFISLGWPEDYVNGLFADWEAVFPRFLDTVANLAAALPEKSFLVRPHPFENHDVYKKRFNGLANLVVDGEGEVFDVIANSECVVHLNCGSAVDSVLLDRIPVSLEFLNTKTLRRHAPLPSRLSCLAWSMDMLIELLRNAHARAAAFDRVNALSLIHPWFHHNDGNASERVASLLVELPPHSPSPSWVAAVRGGRAKPRPGQWIQGVLSVAMGSWAVSTIRGLIHPRRRSKTPGLAAVRRLLDLYADCEGNAMVFHAYHARYPISGLPLSTIEIVTA